MVWKLRHRGGAPFASFQNVNFHKTLIGNSYLAGRKMEVATEPANAGAAATLSTIPSKSTFNSY